MNLFKFIYSIILLYLDFLQNLFIVPLFFIIFTLIELILIIYYYLSKLNYFIISLILFFFNFKKLILMTFFRVEYFFKPFKFILNFKQFFIDNYFIKSREEENLTNKEFYLYQNRPKDHHSSELLDLELVIIDNLIKPQRFYFINDFYRDEKNYLLLINNINTKKLTPNRSLLLRKILKNIKLQSINIKLTKNYNNNTLLIPNQSVLFYKYSHLFSNYTNEIITNFCDYQFFYLNYYIRRRAAMLSVNYSDTAEWFSEYCMYLKTQHNFNPGNFDIGLIDDYDYFDDFDEAVNFSTEFDNFSLLKNGKLNKKNLTYQILLNDLNYIIFEQKIKLTFSKKIKFLIYFYNNYLIYLFKKDKFLLLYSFNKILKLFYYNKFNINNIININYYINLIYLIFLLFSFIKNTIINIKFKIKYYYYYYYLIILFNYYIEILILIPIIQINYFWCFLIEKIILFLKYLWLLIIK